jgi:hypothetical protein
MNKSRRAARQYSGGNMDQDDLSIQVWEDEGGAILPPTVALEKPFEMRQHREASIESISPRIQIPTVNSVKEG